MWEDLLKDGDLTYDEMQRLAELADDQEDLPFVEKIEDTEDEENEDEYDTIVEDEFDTPAVELFYKPESLDNDKFYDGISIDESQVTMSEAMHLMISGQSDIISVSTGSDIDKTRMILEGYVSRVLFDSANNIVPKKNKKGNK